MNYKLKKFISAAILFSAFATMTDDNCSSCSTCPDTCAQGQNTWQPHAFSASMGREALVLKHAWVPTDNEESWHGTVAVAGEYQRSFKQGCGEISSCCEFIGSLPFWGKNEEGHPTYSNTMTFGNGATETVDLDAYQVGMGPVKTSGKMTLSPAIYQAGADFYLYIGAHKIERGFFFTAHGPVGVINVNPRFTFSDDVIAEAYPAGTLNSSATEETPAPNANLGDAFSNPKAAGQFLKPMTFGLICGNRTSSAKFGDPEFTLGYNVYADEKKHVGIGIRFAAPTGNKASAVYMLEPIFGRDGHWAAGGELIGHWRFWESDTCADRYVNFMFDGSALHLFNSKTMRSFDLKNNGAGSKYLLVAKFDSASDGATFQNEITNAINITTLNITSSFALEGNFAALLDFHWDNWSLALGYEGWGRTCENLGVDCSCPGSVDFNEYAVVGRQSQITSNELQTVPLCQPEATIGKVQPLQHTADASKGILDASKSKSRIPSAIQDALDMEGQVARPVYTNKPFAQLQYTWLDSDYRPYLAMYGGAEIPVGSHSKNSAVKFWNIGAQGGIAF